MLFQIQWNLLRSAMKMTVSASLRLMRVTTMRTRQRTERSPSANRRRSRLLYDFHQNDASVADAHEGTSKSNAKAPENSTIARDWDADTSMFTTGTPGSRGRVSTSPANSPSLDDSFGDVSLPSASFIARRPSLFEEPIVRVTAANKKKGRDSPVMVLMKPKLKLPENAPGLRRSQRVKVPRLQSHLNQRVVYKTLADGTREVASILDVVIKDKEMKKLRTADPVVMADERQRHQRVVKQRAEQKLAHDPKAQMRAEKKKTLRQKHKKGFDLSHSSDEALAHSLDQVSLLDDED
uniref:Uncharacterized protein n=1 Tax=Plectus sambesii TaxID=2011161 RepID=A0A914WG48_9BILA